MDVYLRGGRLQLTFDTTNNPGRDWTAYSIGLTESSGWRLGTAAPTPTEMFQVLGNVTDLRIRGEFRVGADVGSLDNVVFGAANPDPSALIPVDVTSTFLRTHPEGTPVGSTIIDLATALGEVPIEPGDYLRLEREGDFFIHESRGVNPPPGFEGPHAEEGFSGTLRNMWGVFSSSDELRDTDVQIRVPGAIEPSDGHFTPLDSVPIKLAGDTLLLTDIDGDFIIDLEGDLFDPEGVIVQVPEGASHLFVAAGDIWWSDNTATERSYGLRITKLPPAPAGCTVTGDGNCDGTVNIDDLNLVRNHFGAVVQPGRPGDTFPSDGVVNIDYLNAVRNNFGATAGVPAAVPQPATIVLMLLATPLLTFPFRTSRNESPGNNCTALDSLPSSGDSACFLG